MGKIILLSLPIKQRAKKVKGNFVIRGIKQQTVLPKAHFHSLHPTCVRLDHCPAHIMKANPGNKLSFTS